ncbi:permease component of ribose/xylose/arabinose/galactoside ABC-type transporters [Halobacteroides halobius DSM 5150]|uniref:Permease component of ribose/xylose/arabinose/galactoside ABC-type transporters n=1 Tax=Halobacteroides halobius (strain ATCC 35273 / DSM 5150 / MD-1) TaxID=748449 RepID=L0KDE0_HALHC|nr:ABC transporter permease [Halobacteroides halobius]AGB42384.1 permease component of ribose/xylose/arabinose/galactoside ABC-type transporters [Halobacteroides halobius DSM 5150]
MSVEKSTVKENINGEGIEWKELLFDKLGPLLGLILLMGILSVASPYFLSISNLMNVAQQASINALIASGELLAILIAGIDLSVGSVLALSICVGGVAIKAGVSPLVGILIILATGALVGTINGLLLTKLNLPHPFISTLGMMNIARGLALIVTDSSPVSGFSDVITFIGVGQVGIVPFSVILVLIMAVIFYYFLNKTSLGRHIYAVGGNIEAARLSGINTDKVRTIVFTIAGLMAAMGGLVLMGRVNSAYPLAGLKYELNAIAAVIIGGASFFGGIGTIWGTMIGAMIIAVIRNGLNLLGVSADIQTVVIGVVIIAAVYVDVLRQRDNE